MYITYQNNSVLTELNKNINNIDCNICYVQIHAFHSNHAAVWNKYP